MSDEYIRPTIFRQPIEIILNSKRGTTLGGIDGYKFFSLEEELKCNKDEYFLLYLKKAFIPFSFYTISTGQYNSDLDVKETQIGGANNSYSIRVENGNYNIDELILEIKTKLEDASTYNYKYTITYSSITNKLTFLIASGTSANKTELLFLSGGNTSTNLSRVIGFTKADVEFTTSSSLTSDLVCDLCDGLDSLHIKCNLTGDNIRSVIGGINGGELLIMPIESSPNSILYFDEQNNPFKHKLATPVIKRIDIKFTDNNDNIVDFNSIPYTLICIVEFIKDPNINLTTKNKYLTEKDPKKFNFEKSHRKIMNMMLNNRKKISYIQ